MSSFAFGFLLGRRRARRERVSVDYYSAQAPRVPVLLLLLGTCLAFVILPVLLALARLVCQLFQ